MIRTELDFYLYARTGTGPQKRLHFHHSRHAFSVHSSPCYTFINVFLACCSQIRIAANFCPRHLYAVMCAARTCISLSNCGSLHWLYCSSVFLREIISCKTSRKTSLVRYIISCSILLHTFNYFKT